MHIGNVLYKSLMCVALSPGSSIMYMYMPLVLTCRHTCHIHVHVHVLVIVQVQVTNVSRLISRLPTNLIFDNLEIYRL